MKRRPSWALFECLQVIGGIAKNALNTFTKGRPRHERFGCRYNPVFALNISKILVGAMHETEFIKLMRKIIRYTGTRQKICIITSNNYFKSQDANEDQFVGQ